MNWGLWKYDLPLVCGMLFDEDLLTHRTGLLACLSDGQGEWWLEVGPVTVLGGPDLNDLVRWCGIWADHWFSNLPPWNIRARLRDAGCPGPVMDTIAGTWSLGMRARRTLLQGMRRKVWLTALLELSDGDASDVFRVARRIAESGYRYAKIKTRGCRSESAVDLLRGIRKTLGPFCQVRVDFNASWSPDSVAEVICGALLPEQGLAPVMYLEDPLPPGGQADSALWPVPLALDTRAFLNQLIAPAICSRVQWGVWKPFVSWPVRFQMLQQGWSVTVSSACESGVGTAALAALALYGNIAPGAGLGSYQWLREDVLARRLPVADRPWADLRDLLVVSQSVVTDRLSLVQSG